MPKREYGSGGLRARHGARGVHYQVVYRHEGRRAYKTFRTREYALLWLRQQRAAADAGTLRLPTRLTVKQLLDRWFEARGSKRARNTVLVYEQAISRLGPLHAAPAARLGPERIDRLVTDLLAAGYAPKTAGLARSVLGMAYRWGMARKLVVENPVALSEPPPRTSRERPALSVEQARRFARAAAADPQAALWRWLIVTGQRRGAALALRWEQLDLEAGLLHQPAFKGGRPRLLRLPPALVALLAQLRTDQQGRALVDGGPAWRPVWPVFGIGARAASGEWLRQGFRRVLRAAELDDLTPHGLRHTAASVALALGQHPKAVQELLGHSSSQITLDVYSHLASEQVTGVMEALDSAIFGGVVE